MGIDSAKRRKPTAAENDVKIASRAQKRIDNGVSLDAVAEYLNRARPERLEYMQALTWLTLPLRRALMLALRLREAGYQYKAAQARQRARQHLDQLRAEQAELEQLQTQYAAHDADGDLIRWLAGLPPSDRDRVGQPAERRQAIEMRMRSLMSGAVRRRLNCTQTELDRWDAQGLLPHLYTRIMPYKKNTRCRFWFEYDIEAAKYNLKAWREDWEMAKRARRRKPKESQ